MAVEENSWIKKNLRKKVKGIFDWLVHDSPRPVLRKIKQWRSGVNESQNFEKPEVIFEEKVRNRSLRPALVEICVKTREEKMLSLRLSASILFSISPKPRKRGIILKFKPWLAVLMNLAWKGIKISPKSEQNSSKFIIIVKN